MTTLPSPTATRRRFLNTGARYAILGGLGTYAIGQVIKAGRLVSDPNCIRLDTCSECVEFTRCTLRKADEFRRRSTPA